MDKEPEYHPFYATPEQRVEFIDDFLSAYGESRRKPELCACAMLIVIFDKGCTIKPYHWSGAWCPQMYHSKDVCYVYESDTQAECGGPGRKLTGAYIGCVNCEPYVHLVKTRDSPYVYGVQFDEDLMMQVFDGDTPLDGVLEVKVGVGGYIIQVRMTPDPHHCPCYLAHPDEDDIEAKICRVYIPGNNYRVEEPEGG